MACDQASQFARLVGITQQRNTLTLKVCGFLKFAAHGVQISQVAEQRGGFAWLEVAALKGLADQTLGTLELTQVHQGGIHPSHDSRSEGVGRCLE